MQHFTQGGQSVLVSTKERFASESRRSATRSPSSAVFRVEQDDHGGRGGGESSAPRPPRRNSGRGIEETDDNLEGSPSDKSSGSMLINPSEGSSYNSHSPQRRHNKSKHSGVARKVNSYYAIKNEGLFTIFYNYFYDSTGKSTKT